MDSLISTQSAHTATECKAAIAQLFADMERLNEQMQQDQAEIDRLKAETCHIKSEAERLKIESYRLQAENRVALDRLKAGEQKDET